MDNDINVSNLTLNSYIAVDYFYEYKYLKDSGDIKQAEKMKDDYFYKYYSTIEPYVSDWIQRLKCDAKLKTLIRNSIDLEQVYRHLQELFDDDTVDESDSDSDNESESELVFSSGEE